MSSERGPGSMNGLRDQANRAIALPAEDFARMPAAEVQKLLGALVVRQGELETQVEALRRDQAELEESRKQSVDLFDFAPVGYFNVDRRGFILSVNITGCDMVGISRAKLVNEQFPSLVEPQYHEALHSYLKEIAETGQRLSTEVEMHCGDDRVFHAQLQTVLTFEKSNLVYRISVADITERKRAEKALQESEQRYRDLADLLPEIVFESDAQGRITYANKEGLVAFSLTPDDIARGISVFNFVFPGYLAFARQRFGRVLEQEDIGPEEYLLQTRDGTTFAAVVHSAPIQRAGQVVGIRGIVLDITQRKQIEQTLRESELRFRSILDSMLEGCLLLDFNWRYTYANEAVARQGRLTREQIIGRTPQEVLPGIEGQEIYARMKESMEKRVPQELETEVVYPDGARRWFDIHIEPVPEGILILYVNITTSKLARQV
ncbi:MAG: PAS domain S-box protein [Chloroflexi bacterium]|nr:PAS domain S-box protein [Chloroflexota bacterium]